MNFESEPNSKTTAGITVSVETSFLPEQSTVHKSHYAFAYRITILNESNYTVKLMRRRWVVTDALGEIRIVEGEGVVGQQPVIAPGESHTYLSGAHFSTPIGKMEGEYQMKRMLDESEFSVAIPQFILEYPFVLN